MKTRKILAALMALTCMTSATSMIASAELTAAGTAAPINATVETKIPTVSVTLPTDLSVIYNPYNLEVTVGSDKVTDSVISPEYELSNASDVPVTISATVTGTPSSADVKLATAAPKNTETTKTMFIFMETVAADAEFTGTYTKAAGQLLVAAAKPTTAEICTLAQTDGAAKMKFSGAVNHNVTWTADDKCAIEVTFGVTLEPLPAATGTGA